MTRPDPASKSLVHRGRRHAVVAAVAVVPLAALLLVAVRDGAPPEIDLGVPVDEDRARPEAMREPPETGPLHGSPEPHRERLAVDVEAPAPALAEAALHAPSGPLGRVVGLVLGPRGAVPAGEVTLRPVEPSSPKHGVLPSRTVLLNSRGRFEIGDVPIGPYEVRVEVSELVHGTQRIDVVAHQDSMVTVVLQDFCRCEGRLVGTNPHLLRGSRLELVPLESVSEFLLATASGPPLAEGPPRPDPPKTVRARLDSAGRFRTGSLPRGPYRAYLRLAGSDCRRGVVDLGSLAAADLDRFVEIPVRNALGQVVVAAPRHRIALDCLCTPSGHRILSVQLGDEPWTSAALLPGRYAVVAQPPQKATEPSRGNGRSARREPPTIFLGGDAFDPGRPQLRKEVEIAAGSGSHVGF